MNDIKSTINLGEYIGKLKGKGQFIIPKYQRGYIWDNTTVPLQITTCKILLHILLINIATLQEQGRTPLCKA